MAVKAFPLCCLWSLIHPRALLRLLCFSGSWVSVGYFLFFLLKSYLMCLCIFSLSVSFSLIQPPPSLSPHIPMLVLCLFSLQISSLFTICLPGFLTNGSFMSAAALCFTVGTSFLRLCLSPVAIMPALVCPSRFIISLLHSMASYLPCRVLLTKAQLPHGVCS